MWKSVLCLSAGSDKFPSRDPYGDDQGGHTVGFVHSFGLHGREMLTSGASLRAELWAIWPCHRSGTNPGD